MNSQINFLLNKSFESIRNTNLESAEIYLKQALRLQSNNSHVLRLLGVVYAQRRQYSEALEYLNNSLKALPKNSLALSNLGNVYHELKRYDDALDAYDKSIKIDQKYEEVWSNKGNTLYELRRFEEALAHFDKALSLKPDFPEGWFNKGNALRELRRFEEALAHFDKALSLRPDYVEGWTNKAVTLNELRRFEEALAHFDKALSLRPDVEWVGGELLHLEMKICSWSRIKDFLHNLADKIMSNKRVIHPFKLLSLIDDAVLHKKCSEIYIQHKYPFNAVLGINSKLPKNHKIRIAYFSPDFRNHPVSLLTSELFEIHDRQRFEIFGFSLHGAPASDLIRMRLKNGFDKFIEAENLSDLQVAQLARELKVDIAVDLAGITQHSRTGIFAYRAAPIQVNWLGYPGTLGAEYYDYVIADSITIPEDHRSFYTEKVAYLPYTYMVDDSKRIASSKVFTRQECGLPDDAFIFCSFNNDYKFNPEILNSWSKILLQVKKSILWLPENNQIFKTNLLLEFEKRGINPDQIIFAKRVELMGDHLARIALADLFLDNYPYNAHSTAIDSLKVGVPVLTFMGQSFASRVAASLLHAIGLPELITRSKEDYESLAIELSTNFEKLAIVKQKLIDNLRITPLFDTPLFSKNLETLYIKIYERYQNDLPTDHIFIT